MPHEYSLTCMAVHLIIGHLLFRFSSLQIPYQKYLILKIKWIIKIIMEIYNIYYG